MVDGREFIIVPSGNGSTSVTAAQLTRYASVPRSRSRPRLLAYALGGSAPAPPWAEVPRIPKPAVPRLEAAKASAGSGVFQECSSCHGYDAQSLRGAAPDLRLRLTPSPEHLKVVLGGVLAAKGMPAFDLSDEDVQALYAYLVNTTWDAYEAQEQASKVSEK
jgi:quinohemoprotein ethanol dehydrogenase